MKKSKTKQKIVASFLLLFCMLFLSGCGCVNKEPVYSIELEVWGLVDDNDVYDEIFNNYSSYVNKHVVKINYRKFTVDTYKRELLDALASGQGPDIFLIHNTWLPIFVDKIIPAPTALINENRFKENFVDVVANDFLFNGQVYAAPLSVNTLALFYNKDLLNEAGIVLPPANWTDFMKDSQKITQVASGNRIIRSGAIMGTAYNINRATDIVSVLMLQGGTQMIDPIRKTAAFDGVVKSGNQNIAVGENALDFYTQFARNTSSMYSWNVDSHYSIDAFSEGWAAMMLNYSWNIDTIKAKSPNLNFGIAPLPQLNNNQTTNYANYWAFAVAKNKIVDTSYAQSRNLTQVNNDVRATEAWKLISFLTTKPTEELVAALKNQKSLAASYDPTVEYLKKTNVPSARRDLIELQKNDPKIGVFARQNLTAKSWLQIDPEAIETIFLNMIDEVNRGKATVSESIKAAATRVTQLMQR